MAVLRTEADFAELAHGLPRPGARAGRRARRDLLRPAGAHRARRAVRDGHRRPVAALRESEARYGITSKLIMCFLRDQSAESAMATLEQALPYGERIVAVGLDSAEVGNPPSKFAQRLRARAGRGLEDGRARRRGRAAGLRLGGARSARVVADRPRRAQPGGPAPGGAAARRAHPADRLPALQRQAARGRPAARPPAGRMLDAGLVATVNSDDPAYFGGYVGDNFAAVADALALPRRRARDARPQQLRGVVPGQKRARRTSRVWSSPRAERR